MQNCVIVTDGSRTDSVNEFHSDGPEMEKLLCPYVVVRLDPTIAATNARLPRVFFRFGTLHEGMSTNPWGSLLFLLLSPFPLPPLPLFPSFLPLKPGGVVRNLGVLTPPPLRACGKLPEITHGRVYSHSSKIMRS